MKVYTCLVGDLFHKGHVEYLKKCKSLGNHLLVGVCSDEDAIFYKRKPILNFEERLAVIESCKFVDSIVLKPPSIITNEFLEMNQIDLVVHGDDSNEDQLRHFYSIAIDQNMYRSVGYTTGISTTEIINRIRTRSDSEVVRKNVLFGQFLPHQ